MTFRHILQLMVCLLCNLVTTTNAQVNSNLTNSSTGTQGQTIAVVLTYHHVADDTPAITSVSPEVFEQQLNYLQQHHFQVWSLPQIVSALQERTPIPDKVVGITFDDAYASVFEQAYPLLKEKNYPFTIFVTTDSVDKRYNNQLSWQQLKEMSQNGATIANHTVSHPHMLRYLDKESDAMWQQRMKNEVTLAQQRIDDKMGYGESNGIKLFAYPYGEHNEALKKLLSDLGYIAFGQQSGAIGPQLDPQVLPRFPISGRYTGLDDFALKIKTLPLPAQETTASDNPLTVGHAEPSVSLTFNRDINRQHLQCYGPGGLLPIQWQENTATIMAAQQIPAGRSRYNCTLPAPGNRYYWYSKPWVRLKKDGSWVMD